MGILLSSLAANLDLVVRGAAGGIRGDNTRDKDGEH